MRVTILVLGSRGDLRPLIALGVGLAGAGHRVTCATYGAYGEIVQRHGLACRALPGNPAALIGAAAARTMGRAGANPLRYLLGLRAQARAVRSVAAQFCRKCLDACRDAELLIYTLTSPMGASIAEALRIPSVQALLTPVTPTRAFASFLSPGLFERSASARLASHFITAQVLWQPYRSILNRWRRDDLKLPPLPVLGPRRRTLADTPLTLYGFSSGVIPPPADWPASVHVTGYWFLDEPDWRPPAELVAFLAAGKAPIAIDFGSMAFADDGAAVQAAIDAVMQSGRRGILLAPEPQRARVRLPGDILALDFVPHRWLLPHIAALIHHGGAGTTAAALRAGIPSVIVPFHGDQTFWGRRCLAMGASAAPIPRKRLTAGALAAALDTVTATSSYREQAHRIAERIAREDGVACAVDILTGWLGGSARRSPRHVAPELQLQ